MTGGARGTVRIIGGRWRGTRIAVADSEELRPTSDRVRETLFNWLTPMLPGARCLDLFAGTGALGFEAVSRGAGSCDLVELNGALARALTALKERLKSDQLAVHQADARQWLRRTPSAYDIVFIDPPFSTDLTPSVLHALAQGWLAATALVYLETARDAPAPGPGWEIHRQGSTRQVSYALLRHTG